MPPGLQSGCIHYVVKLIGQFCAVMNRVNYGIEAGAIIDDAKKAFHGIFLEKGYGA